MTNYNLKLDQSLQLLGLTENEAKIYVYLLKRGLALGADIHQDNQLDKSSAYEALSNLQRKGLIYTLGQKRNQKFAAVAVEKLLEIVDEKEKELQSVKSDLGELISNLEEYAKQSYNSKQIKIIQGSEAFKTWAFARISGGKGSTVREISSNLVQEKFLNSRAEYINYSAVDMPKQRIKYGVNLKAMLQQQDLDSYSELNSIEQTNPKLLKEVRLLPAAPDFIIPCSLVTYTEHTALMRKYEGEFLGIEITDKLITGLLNSMFDFIWKQLPII